MTLAGGDMEGIDRPLRVAGDVSWRFLGAMEFPA